MTREHWLRGHREADESDWRQPARELDVDIDTARTLYEYAMHVALDDRRRAEPLYRSALHAVARAGSPSEVERVVGRMTRVMYEASPGKYWTNQQLAAAGLGKWTRVQIETTRDSAALPGYADVQAAMSSLLGSSLPAPGAVTPRTAPDPRDAGPPDNVAGPGTPSAWLPDARAPGVPTGPAPQRAAALLFRSQAEPAEDSAVDHPAVAAALARRGAGEQLPETLRREMEAKLGAELGGVRVHTDAIAAAAARAVGARAFTVGHDIFFAEGAFDLRSTRGRELLAHELTHVVQVQHGRVAEPAAGQTRISDPHEAMELEAEQVARRVAQSSSEPPEPDTERSQVWRTIWGRPRAPRAPAPVIRAPRSSGALFRAPEPVEEGPLRIPPGGLPVDEIGIVAWDGKPSLRLRTAPSTAENNIIASLAFNTRVQVMQRFPGNWLLVTTRDGKTGFCAQQHVWYPPERKPPEANARLHRVARGEHAQAIHIARHYYGHIVEPSRVEPSRADLRFYVSVLGAMNQLPVPDEGDGWKTVQFEPDDLIWIPSIAFARSLWGTSEIPRKAAS